MFFINNINFLLIIYCSILSSLYSSETESIYLSYATPILLLSISDLENSLFKNSLPNAIFGKNKKFNMSFISSSMDPLFTSSQNDTVNYIFYLYYKNIILLYNKLSLYINIYIYLI